MVKKALILVGNALLLLVFVGAAYAVLIVITVYGLWFAAYGAPAAIAAIAGLGFWAGWRCRARAA
jgi:hypothetical protein